MTDDLFIGGGNGGAHPVRGINIAAEFVGIAVLAVLCLRCDSLPHIPRLAETVLYPRQVGGVGLVAVAGSVGAAAVRDEDKVVLDKVDRLFLAVLDIDYLLCDLFVPLILDDDILHIHAVFDAHAVRFKVFHERQYHALVLIVLCEAERAEIGESVNVMDIAAEVALHLKSARPALEGEHRLPIEPEIRTPEAVGKNVRDLLVLKILFGREEEL